MRSRFFSSYVVPVSVLFAALNPFARATVQNRIAGSVSGSSRVALPGTISGHARRSVDLGPAPGDRKLESMSLRFSMTAAQEADLNQLLAAQLDPSSPSYHQWLTPEQFGARFGLSSSDLTKVSSWLTSQGFTVTSVARSSTFITFNGTVAQAQVAFGTQIHNLSLNGEQHISNVTDPTFPAAIAGVVNTVIGLDDFKLKPRSRRTTVAVDPAHPLFTQTVGGVTSHYISPADFYTIYDVGPLTTSGITGAGVGHCGSNTTSCGDIAVMGQTQIIPTQVTAFRGAAGFASTAAPVQFLVPGSANPGVSSSDIDEAQLDVEWSGAAAQGATILYVYSTDVFNSLTYAIDNKSAPILTISYGLCESSWGLSTLKSDNLLLAQANAQGQTVMAPAGDAGATDCDVAGLATEGLNLDFPGSSPYVTAAGGTMFSGDVGAPGTYWNGTNGANGSSAISYIPEQPWNETTGSSGLDAGGAAGGGASAFFSKPAWQTGLGVPSDSSRDTPDISLNAAAMHDGYLVCSQNTSEGEAGCASNSFLSSTSVANVFGGTSFVAPSLAGILALVEQKLGTTGGLGNIGPTLYGFLNGPTYTSVFHDITSGNISVACAQGTLNCPNGGSIGFNAGTGYDQATGIGSFDISKLVNGWSSVVPVGIGGAIGAGITTTSVTTSNAICGVTGTLALTITVTGSVAGTTPTGTVQILVDNAAVAGGIVTLSGGTATYSLVASSLSSGGHVVSAVYSGDGNFAGSKGTLLGPATNTAFYPNGPIASVDVVSGKDFGLTPCTGTSTAVTVQPGATAAGVTLTITPAGGFTGTVNLTATNNDGMTATTSFSAASVNVTSGAVTTSFVVKASQTSAALRKPGLTPDPKGGAPWYVASSGAALACVVLLVVPRRRRWGSLLAVLFTAAALTAALGCGSSSSNSGGSGGGTGGGGSTTNATPGTYSFTITAVSGSLVHSTQVTVNVP
ncbi:MAG TPA: protease pro-enzyme activation domain-containing protein [Edaphobacter sp.]|jgi:subtilase family serine protease|nr:protease pro-enzyme activation domain-containing protein [Edaphobacter sp.]